MGIYDGLLRVYRNLRLVHMNLRLVHMNLRLVHMNLRLVHMNALCFSSNIRSLYCFLSIRFLIKLPQFRSPCPVCGKKYSDLRQHVRIVHEGAKV